MSVKIHDCLALWSTTRGPQSRPDRECISPNWAIFFKSSRPKVMRGNESSHMTSYLLWVVIMCLGSTVLKIQLFENIVTSIWPFRVSQGHEGIWNFIFDFLSVVSGNYEARSHRFEDTGVWKYFDLDLTFQGHQGQRSWGEMKVHIWLPMS